MSSPGKDFAVLLKWFAPAVCVGRYSVVPAVYKAFAGVRPNRVRRLHCTRSVDRLDATL
jgi:hypothetical protein